MSVSNSSVRNQVNHIKNASQELDVGDWLNLYDVLKRIMDAKWFDDVSLDSEDLLNSMARGDVERSRHIINNHPQSDDIIDTMSKIINQIETKDQINEDDIRSLEEWVQN